MVLILALASLGAFLCSVALLRAGLDVMAWRYAAAAAFGYLLFLALIRVWLAYQRRRLSFDLSGLDAGGGGGSWGSGGGGFAGQGGSFGGGGASGSFGPTEASSGTSLPDLASGIDDSWPVALGVAALLAGLLALGFVVYVSPVLFAEVLFDAAVAGAVYRRVRARSRGHWLRGVLRRTWKPALVLCAVGAGVGIALHYLAPETRSLGEAARALIARPW
jgi:uncharacterized membrane protein YgcG